MSTTGQILIVDDDQGFLDIYQELLNGLGLAVSVAKSPERARDLLASTGQTLDVVLLDQKLHGPGGGNSGLELLRDIAQRAPFAKVIIVTGYAAPDAIESAFRLGAYDYLVKNGAFSALLTAKVRNAIEVTSERRLASMTKERVIVELRDTWTRVRAETDRNRKGALLEELVKLLFRATPGFERVKTRLTNEIEEIDIVVENAADGSVWRTEGPYVLGECKNWSSKCGPAEYNHFRNKLGTKFGRTKVGFFVAMGGFTDAFFQDRAADKKAADQVLVIPVDAQQVQQWITADDRLAFVSELHQRATFDQT